MTAKKKELPPFQKNMRETELAIKKLEKAGYELGGSVSGVSVYKVTEKTLKNGNVVKTLEPIWRGLRYTDAVQELLGSSKKEINGNATAKKLTVKAAPKRKRALKAAKPLKSKPVPKKTETKKTTSKKARYSAKKVNGKGYIFDRNFSLKVPIAVEKTYEKAAEYAKKYNEEK